jgi:hypothetical protein
VLERKLPDELWRFNVALISLSTLRFQLEVLFEAAAKLTQTGPL